MSHELVRHLDGKRFVAMIRAGHERLKANVSYVNSLNIFPVPDGDTGTNMEMSLAAGVAKLNAQAEWTLSAAAHALASGLLMGARGNSGVILSQLFRGFLRFPDTEEVDVPEFAKAFAEGVQIAYRAVAKPVEGTMLTVAREAAAAGTRAARQTVSFVEWMHVVVEAAQAALAKTPEQLPVLKQAGVVDSGGQGFVFILEGFLAFLEGRSVRPDDSRAAAGTAVHWTDFAAAHVEGGEEFGFCTEVLVRATGPLEPSEAKLRAVLAQYGTSLLVVGADDLIKVHVHTLDPVRVLQDALKHGDLVKVKIENMTEQHRQIREHGIGVAVDGGMQPEVTDQAATAGAPPVGSPDPAAVSGAGTRKAAVIAVAAGDGLREIFRSLGVDCVLSGGQTMNPSTEEIVSAVESIPCDAAIILPNNKNIIMAAEQAKQVLGDRIYVVPTTSIPQGIAAVMVYRPDLSAADNAARMRSAAEGVRCGQVVRAVRDSVYQDVAIKANQYLGLVDQALVEVGDDRLEVALSVLQHMGADEAELLTVFYGASVAEQEARRLEAQAASRFGIAVELRAGGQPVYDYIFALE